METTAEALPLIPGPDGEPIVPPIPPNFFPDIERDGIDFTGKVSGLLMIPPSPLGLIYLLLGLIKFGEEEVNALAAPVEEEGCPVPEDPSVNLEAEENPCEPDQIP